MREADPWLCYVCEPAPLARLAKRCAALVARRNKISLKRSRREARWHAAAPAGRGVSDLPSRAFTSSQDLDDVDDGAAGGAALPAGDGRTGGDSRTGGGGGGARAKSAAELAHEAQEATAAAIAAAAAEEEEEDARARVITLWAARGEAGAVTVLPRLARQLKPHQEEGVHFLWGACFGSKRADNAKRREHGCVLAHSMGLGETLACLPPRAARTYTATRARVSTCGTHTG